MHENTSYNSMVTDKLVGCRSEDSLLVIRFVIVAQDEAVGTAKLPLSQP